MPACRRKQACSALDISILTMMMMMIPLSILLFVCITATMKLQFMGLCYIWKLAASISYYEVASSYKKNRKNRNHNLLKKWRVRRGRRMILKDLLTLKVQWRNEFHKNICRKLKLRWISVKILGAVSITHDRGICWRKHVVYTTCCSYWSTIYWPSSSFSNCILHRMPGIWTCFVSFSSPKNLCCYSLDSLFNPRLWKFHGMFTI